MKQLPPITPHPPRFPNLLLHLKLSLVFLALLVTGLLRPSLFYSHSTQIGRFTVYDDRPQSPDLEPALIEVDLNLAKAHISTKDTVPIYFCSTAIRCALLLIIDPFLAGTYLPGRPGVAISHKVPIGPMFPLTESITHELAHRALYQKIGYFRFLSLPIWIQEGYAGYVAAPSYPSPLKGSRLSPHDFERDDYFQARVATSFLLDTRNLSLEEVLKDPPHWPEVLSLARPIVAKSALSSLHTKPFAANEYTSLLVATLYYSLERAKQNLKR